MTEADATDQTPEAAGSGGMTTPSWAEQDELLRALWQQGVPPEAIGQQLGRSVAAVMTRAARLGLPRRAAPGRKPGRGGFGALQRTDRPASVKRERSVALVDEEAPKPQLKERICLMCLRKFMSQGSYNRICPSCKGTAAYQSACGDVAESVSHV